jgi:hypothetical protein
VAREERMGYFAVIGARRTQAGPARTRVRSITVKRERACEARGKGMWNSRRVKREAKSVFDRSDPAQIQELIALTLSHKVTRFHR